MKQLSEVLRTVPKAYERLASRFERAVSVLERRYTPLGRFRPGPFEGWNFLRVPTALGFVGVLLILLGSSFTNSPFKLDMAHTWFFGEPSISTTPSETKFILSVIMVYGGMLLLMRVWLRLVEIMKLHPGAPLRQLWWMFAVWATPLVVAPPLFSRDVFSYAAQGEMTAYHLSPYVLGPFALGSSPFVNPVDPLWGNTPAPYGPFFLSMAGFIDRLARHSALGTVVGLRLLALASVIVIGLVITKVAARLSRDPGEAFALSVLNPLVLITLIAGAHNDAVMSAFLVVGIYFALRGQFGWAVVWTAAAASIKAPAAIGLAFLAWQWAGAHASWRERRRALAKTALLSAAVLGGTTWVAGFGFGWVRNLFGNGVVQSWAAPATAVGLLTRNALHALGAGSVSTTVTLTVTRSIGLALATVLTLWLLALSPARGWIRALGVALIVFVELGPVVQPWYLAWGLILLAVSYRGREHFWILLLSFTAPFMGLPGGQQMLTDLVHANVGIISLTLLSVGSVLLIPMGRWTQWSWPEEVSLAA